MVGYPAHQDLVAPDVGCERHWDHLIAGRRWCDEVVVERGENLAFRIARLVHRPYDLADDERAGQIGTEPQPGQQSGPSPRQWQLGPGRLRLRGPRGAQQQQAEAPSRPRGRSGSPAGIL